MTASWLHRGMVVVALAACAEPAPPPRPPAHAPPSQDEITASAMAAVGAAPWDSDPTGWGALCDSKSPCDTIVIDPTVVSLPAQAPAFFVPDHRPPAGVLELAKLDLASLPQRRVVLGSWRECNARRDGKGWTKGRTACVAVGIAGLESARPDAMTFALLVLTPAKGLSWPRIRVTRPQNAWRGRVLSNAGE